MTAVMAVAVCALRRAACGRPAPSALLTRTAVAQDSPCAGAARGEGRAVTSSGGGARGVAQLRLAPEAERAQHVGIRKRAFGSGLTVASVAGSGGLLAATRQTGALRLSLPSLPSFLTMGSM